jgi:ribonuclease J
MSDEDVNIHCCGVEEKGHCFAIEYKDEVLFLDAGFNLSKSYYDFLDLQGDEPYDVVSEIVGAPILDNVNLENVVGFCLSHEHSDHVSGLPFIFSEVCTHSWTQPKIFSTRATINGTKYKFDQHDVPYDDNVFIPVEDEEEIPEEYRVKRSSRKFKSLFKVQVGNHYKVMWVPVEHSTLNGYSLAVQLPQKRLVFYTGDFKFDLKNNRPPLNLLKSFRQEFDHVLQICETIGVEDDGITGTEDMMEEKLVQSLTGLDPNLVLVAIRTSEVPRIHTFESLGNRMNRRIALIGTSMRNAYNSMRHNFPGILVGDYVMYETSELKDIPKNDYDKYIFLADARMWHAYNTTFHRILKGGAPLVPDATHPYECSDETLREVGKDDLIIFSTTGPYQTYMKRCQGHMIRHVRASGAMFYPDLHVSGHGRCGDYRILIDTVKPDVLIPFHREEKVRERLAEKVNYDGVFHKPKDGDVYKWGYPLTTETFISWEAMLRTILC